MTPDAVDFDHYPKAHLLAASKAKSSQRWHVNLVRLDLGLVVLAVLLGAAAAFSPPNIATNIALAITIVLVTAIVIRVYTNTKHYERVWYEARSAAESIKTASWRYMIRIEPYDANKESADDILAQTIEEVLSRSPNVVESPARSYAVGPSPEMMRVRSLPIVERKEFYLATRADNAICWYKKRAAENRRSADRWLWFGLAFQGAALVAALAGTRAPEYLRFIGLFGAIATLATASTQLRRHTELSSSYDVAAIELESIQEILLHIRDGTQIREKINDMETAISREHVMWAARRGRLVDNIK